MKIIIKIFLIFFPCVVLAATPNQELMKLLSGLHSMQADFVQVMLNGNSKAQQSSGQMALQRPGKFRWDIQKPNKQLIIADGENIWIYDADLQQATKQKMSYQQADNPAMLLSGSIKDLQKDFIITKLQKRGYGEWFTLMPKTKNSMIQQIQMQFVNNQLTTMYLIDNLGQHSVLKFTNTQVNLHLNAALFSFRPAVGVDVINN